MNKRAGQTNDSPLVSIIVPTKNSEPFLKACLQSIKAQTYPNIELIVVDNFSTDTTQDIAKSFTPHVFSKGPERSSQRNYGVGKATGTHVFIIDSDMELGAEVVAQSIQQFEADPSISGVIIPEESFGTSYWAKAKALERSFYVGLDYIEAARVFPKKLYESLHGYNEAMVSGEDWDLSQRAAQHGKLARISAFIRHNEGDLRLATTLKKKYYYAQKFAAYMKENQGTQQASQQTSPLTRYKLFLSQPGKLFKDPLLGVSMLFLKTAEFGAGAFGFVMSGGVTSK